MKTLIYTTAFGDDHFFRLAELMFQSLRKRGYTGDAAILCDRKPGFSEALGIDAILVEKTGKSPLLKARISQHRDTGQYDHVLFVDSDVVFLREPAPLLALASDRLIVSRDHCPLRRNSFNLTFLSSGKRRDPLLAEIRSINTGVLAAPGAMYAGYMDRWLEEWHSPAVSGKLANHPMKFSELRDQPVMQKLVIENGMDCGYIPDNLLLMPMFYTENQPLHPDTVLLHLNGSSRTTPQKLRIANIMAELNAADNHADFKRICNGLQRGRRQPPFRPLP